MPARGEMNRQEIIVSKCFLNNKISLLYTFCSSMEMEKAVFAKHSCPEVTNSLKENISSNLLLGGQKRGKKVLCVCFISYFEIGNGSTRVKGARRSGLDLCDNFYVLKAC